MKQDPSLTLLCQRIEQQVNRTMKTPKDFEYLSECISATLHQHISATTLKRLWGYLSEPVTPRLSTLNLLAQFVGAESWEAFQQALPSSSLEEGNGIPANEFSSNPSPIEGTEKGVKQGKFSLPIIVGVGGGILIVLLLFFFFSRTQSPTPSHSQTDPITFADSAVKALCVEHWDSNGDGELSYAEAAAVTDLGNVFTENKDITSFDELQYFTGLKSIGEDAFRRCNNLASIAFPGNIKYIKPKAFEKTALVNVTIPSYIDKVGWNSFSYCKSLTRVVCEEGITVIENNPFSEDPHLEEVILPSTINEGPMYNVFYKTPQLTHVVMPLAAPRSRHAELLGGGDLNHSVLFTIPEGSASNYLQKGYYNISDNSKLAWMREEFEAEATRVEALKTAKGITATTEAQKALQDAITKARSATQNAKSYLAIGAQIEAVKSAAKTFLSTATIAAGTDVTAIVRNPQFESMDMGWDVQIRSIFTGCRIGYQNDDGYNDHTNGDVNIHNFLEVWWNDTTLVDGRLTQTITNLPAGRYRLEVDAIATWESDPNLKVTGINLIAGTGKTPMTTKDKKPQHFTVDFTHNRTNDCIIGIDINNTTANWVAMDNVRLYYLGAVPSP